jgi:hypothetical protein
MDESAFTPIDIFLFFCPQLGTLLRTVIFDQLEPGVTIADE